MKVEITLRLAQAMNLLYRALAVGLTARAGLDPWTKSRGLECGDISTAPRPEHPAPANGGAPMSGASILTKQ